MQSNDVANGINMLSDLLAADRLRSYRITYVSSSITTRGAIAPEQIEDLYTHKLICRTLGKYGEEVADLLDMLKSTSFTKISRPLEVRVGVTFHDKNEKPLFAFYSNHFGNKIGIYNGQSIAINGPLSQWLQKILENAFHAELHY